MLLDYQIAARDSLVEAITTINAGIDCSETGTGKTYVACAVAKALHLRIAVVCPRIMVFKWGQVAKEFGVDVVFIDSYEKLRGGRTAHYSKKIGWTLGEAKNKTLIVFDEVHKAKNANTKSSKLLIRAVEQGVRVLMASATAAANPIEMKAIGFALRLFPLKDWWNWCLRNGCKPGRFGGLEFRATSNAMRKIHDSIFPKKGARITKAALGDAFTQNQVLTEIVDGDDGAKIEAAHSEIRAALRDLRTKALSDKDPDSPITLLLRARQRVELLKIEAIKASIELGEDSGFSVVCFVNFRATLDALRKYFPKAEVIHGGQTTADRQLAIDNFQTNVAKIIFVTIASGGVGLSLDDTVGDHPRLALINPSFSAIDLIQALGRIHRASTKSPCLQKILFSNCETERRVERNVHKKLKRIAELNDGDLE